MANLTDSSQDLMERWSVFLERTTAEEPEWIQVTFIISMTIIFIISLVGNILTCTVIYSDKSMHTATNYYLFDLAVSDLIVSFAILFEIHEHLNDTYQFGNLFCKIHFFLVVVLWNNSILIMTALAIERYVAIWHPLMLKSSPVLKRVMKVIVLLWILALAETVPEIWTVEVIRTPRCSMCFTVPTRFARVWNGVLALVTFVIPLGLMLFVYSMIAFKVNVGVRTYSRDKIFNHRDNRSKVNRLVALTVSFLVCWMPFFVLRVLTFAFDLNHLMKHPKWWSVGFRLVAFNSWFSIVLNPLLFSLMSVKFRKALKALWNERFKWPLSKSSAVI